MDSVLKRCTSTKARDRTAFEIAIVCALEIESNAVEASFDEFYDDIDYGKSPGDFNAYTLGRIDHHNVVLAYLPQMGKSASAAVTSHLQSSFPNIRLGLVVGVCGGVPRPPTQSIEIFLGDVVISTGLVQHDFGRQYAHGTIRKDTLMDDLGRPNNEIRAYLRKIQGWRGKQQLAGDIAANLTSLSAKEGFDHCGDPGPETDHLYESDYPHKHQDQKFCSGHGVCSTDEGTTCENAYYASCAELGCQESRLVPRQYNKHGGSSLPSQTQRSTVSDAQPNVHFGLVASGDLVIKSGVHRDHIARKEGIIAFEMEGAGVWDQFPTVIIKGVCDYADSHKSKSWQPFSALVAAACAKAFLQHWTSANGPVVCAPQQSTETSSRLTSSSPPSYSLEKQKSTTKLLSHIPLQRNACFRGRSEVLADLDKHYRKCPTAGPFVLRGMGGIGKTQIVLEYAHRRENTGSAVFWISCFSPDSIRSSFKQVAKAVVKFLGPAIVDGVDIENFDVLGWLNDNPNWILIFDNADDDGIAYSNWIPTQAPGTRPAGQVIFTSRDGRLAGAIQGIEREVPLMTDTEAIELFTSSAPNNSQDTKHEICDVEELVKRLGRLPLAVSLASAYLKQYPWTSIPEYLKHLDNFADRQKLLAYRAAFASYSHSVMSTWELSFARVQQDQPRAAEILLLLGFLGNHAVTLEFLKSVLTTRPLDVRSEVLERLQFLQDGFGLVQDLGLLESLALIRFDGWHISLHPLVYQWIQARLTTDETEEWVVRALLIMFCTQIASKYPIDGVITHLGYYHEYHTLSIMSAAFRCPFKTSEVPYEAYLYLLTCKAVETKPVSNSKALSRHRSNLRSGRGFGALQKLRDSVRTSRRSSKSGTERAGSNIASLDPDDLKLHVAYGLSFEQKQTLARERMRRSLQKEVQCYTPTFEDTASALAELFIYTKHWLGHPDLHPNKVVEQDVHKLYGTILDHVSKLIALLESDSSVPVPFIETLFYWTSVAAHDMGRRRYPIWLAKSLAPITKQLFIEACHIGQRMDRHTVVATMPLAVVAFAKYLDDRNFHGPSHWLPAERFLAAYLPVVMTTSIHAHSLGSKMIDFLCQSMWESEHEDALWFFCDMIQNFEAWQASKWQSRLAERWAILGKADVSFDNLSNEEISLIETLTDAIALLDSFNRERENRI